MIKSLKKYRHFIAISVVKEITLNSRQSLSGMIWILLSPLAGVLSWLFMYNSKILFVDTGDIPYPYFVLSGTMLWGLFITVFNASVNSALNYRNLLSQKKIPFIVLIIIKSAVRFCLFLLPLLFYTVIIFCVGINRSLLLFIFPITTIPIALLAIAFGMFVQLFCSIADDLRTIVAWVVNLFMFVTPVIYPIEAVKNNYMEYIMKINPLTYLISANRSILFHGQIEYLGYCVLICILSIVMIFLAHNLFKDAETKIVERII